MRLVLRLIVWMMMACGIVLASGCATVGGSYCATVQRPFEWRSDAEIDATPIRPLRWIETEAATWEKVCGK